MWHARGLRQPEDRASERFYKTGRKRSGFGSDIQPPISRASCVSAGPARPAAVRAGHGDLRQPVTPPRRPPAESRTQKPAAPAAPPPPPPEAVPRSRLVCEEDGYETHESID